MRAIVIAALFSTRYQAWRYRCALALYVLILIIGSIPGARADMGRYASGLVLHSGGYGILTFLLFSGSPGSNLHRALKSVATVALLGAIDEMVQSLFPYRHATVQDWLVDCAAAAISATLLWLFWPKPEHPLLSS